MEKQSRCVVVTGAAGGMGRAICERLSREGYQVYGLDRRAEGAVLSCDITQRESVETVCRQIKEQAGTLDAIIHAAGIYDMDSLVEMEEERFRRIFEVNLFGIYRVNQVFLPLLKRGGRIVITTSELAPLAPLPFTGIYGITKTALEKYAFSLRMEVGLLGISVSVIRPGAVKTGLLQDSTRALDRFVENTRLYSCNAERFRAIVDRVETKNIPPERIAETVSQALTDRHPRFVYNRNRNFWLRMWNILPAHLQVWLMEQILKERVFPEK